MIYDLIYWHKIDFPLVISNTNHFILEAVVWRMEDLTVWTYCRIQSAYMYAFVSNYSCKVAEQSSDYWGLSFNFLTALNLK